ncbi:hypothetical protein GH714_014333 [Hevea brasiliensis]|uniref:FAD-binding PCMH-type domain-containing protein n=1 Tax=Hevea brasiliensis TaxID=3981 RepID=A0A6A6M9Y8_HEVBR|nr:hypothetical protein GH714_014333 [Hevea brasiliensis]
MAMSISVILSLVLTLLVSFSSVTSESVDDSFLQCISSHSQNHSKTISEFVLAKNTSAYSSVFQSSVRNLRFLNTSTTKPEFIITPFNESHIQAAIVCAKAYDMQIRIRSGGHDYEGLSYVSEEKFVLIDLVNLRSISIDIEKENAWVESGATLGEFYYKIAEKSNVYGFPAGSCPTVGVGGHISGGGFGTIFRKKSMGEDLFWAIRGGGGASFGVIFSWKVRLVQIPPSVTVFKVAKTLEQGASKLLQKWQRIGDKLPEDLFLHAATEVVNASSNNNKTIRVSFDSLYLGEAGKLVPVSQQANPQNFCLTGQLNSRASSKQNQIMLRNPFQKPDWKGYTKSFLSRDIRTDLDTLWRKDEPDSGLRNTIPSQKRKIYKIQYMVTWDKEEETEQHLRWMRSLYSYMAPYVSKSPRAAYLNYRDLDLGRNKNGNTSFAQASVWGLKYFKNNFKRLVKVKTETDPSNFFRNEQSIPVP